MLHEDVQVSGGKASRILNLGSEWGGGFVLRPLCKAPRYTC